MDFYIRESYSHEDGNYLWKAKDEIECKQNKKLSVCPTGISNHYPVSGMVHIKQPLLLIRE